MQLTRAFHFSEAVEKLGSKAIIGSKLTSAQWAEVPVALRERAYFSSTVESTRVLQRSRDMINDFLTGATETLSNGDAALKVGSRAEFVKQMQGFMESEGIIRKSGKISDPASQRRLELIFDVQTRQAQDYGNWKQGQDPDVLDEFPAQRFMRVQGVKEPRDRHRPFENQVRLKSDLDFWLSINQDFGVPWGPWAWGCGHDVEDVDRAETEELGLIQPGEHPVPVEKSFNDRLEASVRGLDKDMQKLLEEAFGDQIEIVGDTARWREPGKRRRVRPDPAPEPAPAPEPPKAAEVPAQPDWRQKMDGLVEEWRRSEPSQLRSLSARAREAIEIPEAQRRSPKLTFSTRNPDIRKTVNSAVAELSRFVHPSLLENTRIEVHATRGSRAFHRNGQIHLHRLGTHYTAAHEIMHGVELQNASVLKSATEFLLRRSEGLAPERLSKLTGVYGYSSDEVAYKDRWKERGGSVYAGKVYSWNDAPSRPDQIRATEIFTMGIERLMHDPLEFYRSDPEWFELIINVLRKP